MTYAVKYLAGAYRVAGGNPNRTVHYYAAGYYYAAKGKGLLNKSSDNPLDAYANAVTKNKNKTALAEPAQDAGARQHEFQIAAARPKTLALLEVSYRPAGLTLRLRQRGRRPAGSVRGRISLQTD